MLSDEKYYKREQEKKDKYNYAIEKARNRGMMADAWFNAGNKLTKETEKEFRDLMKKADKDFDSQKDLNEKGLG